ncbi:MAG TPA: tetratricopeptide repeat protein, partial [Burkholderiaceae bacterium]|nr:tetratricopeptide repeat protein [Burkholderiaceae bacterium]
FAVATIGLLPVARADDPSLHEVYQAVHAGRLNEAQAMMTQVLHDHPDSARAHYVEAEVLVRLGRAAEAQSELEHAERLAPGLAFARPEAVRELRTLIAQGAQGRVNTADRLAVSNERSSESSFPWGPLLIIGGAGLVIFLFLRARRMSGAMGPAVSPAGVPVAPGYGAAPMSAPGIGSGILGGLATGAAVGAGMVAGEALAHEFLGNRDRDRFISDGTDGSRIALDDAGGPDFGVSDAGSWDAGSDIAGDGGGGGDWG